MNHEKSLRIGEIKKIELMKQKSEISSFEFNTPAKSSKQHGNGLKKFTK